MVEFAFISRNKFSKGIYSLIDAFKIFENEETKLHIFSDFSDCKQSNIICHGWVDNKEIWDISFDYVIFPMIAPETYCFSLHESIKRGKGVIINGSNKSLTSQIKSGSINYFSHTELQETISYIIKNRPKIEEVRTLSNRRNLWERL